MKKIILPDRIFGKNTNEALERVLNGEAQVSDPEQEQQNPANVANLKLNGFFYVPSSRIWIAKKRSLNNESWNSAIKQIYEKGFDAEGQRAEMPTPSEFMSGLIYVLDNQNVPNLTKDERAEFLDDILALKNVYRGNHLNARFGNTIVETAVLKNGKVTWESKPIEPCLEKNCYADIRKINSQGLLTKPYGSGYEQGKTAYFWKPVSGYVARFDALSDWANLSCDGGADGSSPSLGVRLAVRPKGTNSKIGVK